MKTNNVWLVMIAALVLASCQISNPAPTQTSQSESTAAPTAEMTSQPEGPIFPAVDWAESSPEAQGMDSAVLAEMVNQILERRINIEGMVIVRSGVKVLETYIYPYDGMEPHIIHSCTKSIVSTLIGIAIEQGFIESADQSIWDYFPEIDISTFPADKQAITIHHLLSMSSGLDCQDSYKYNWQGLRDMTESGNWSEFFLALPTIHEPGLYFEYCNGGSYMLASILKRAAGQTPMAFAEANLFAPLGITPGEWPISPEGVNHGWGSLHLTAKDMARFGWLYLNMGQWDGIQIVPEAYVREAVSAQISSGTLSEDYGYQWWISSEGYYMALGYMGQYIIVVPQEDLVVSVVSSLPSPDFHLPESFLHSHILPSILADDALPENPEALQALEDVIHQASQP